MNYAIHTTTRLFSAFKELILFFSPLNRSAPDHQNTAFNGPPNQWKTVTDQCKKYIIDIQQTYVGDVFLAIVLNFRFYLSNFSFEATTLEFI